jgi:hypothetical protein
MSSWTTQSARGFHWRAQTPFQQCTFALFDPAFELLEAFDVVPERLADGVAVQQTYITPQLGPARSDSGKILESAGTIGFQIDTVHATPRQNVHQSIH